MARAIHPCNDSAIKAAAAAASGAADRLGRGAAPRAAAGGVRRGPRRRARRPWPSAGPASRLAAGLRPTRTQRLPAGAIRSRIAPAGRRRVRVGRLPDPGASHSGPRLGGTALPSDPSASPATGTGTGAVGAAGPTCRPQRPHPGPSDPQPRPDIGRATGFPTAAGQRVTAPGPSVVLARHVRRGIPPASPGPGPRLTRKAASRRQITQETGAGSGAGRGSQIQNAALTGARVAAKRAKGSTRLGEKGGSIRSAQAQSVRRARSVRDASAGAGS